MSSLANRIALVATLAFAGALLVVFVASSFAIAPRIGELAAALPFSRIAEARALAGDARAEGANLTAAAPKIVDRLTKLDLRVAVYDVGGSFVAGDRELRPPPVPATAPAGGPALASTAADGPRPDNRFDSGPLGGPGGPGPLALGHFGRVTIIPLSDGFVTIGAPLIPPWRAMLPYWGVLAGIAAIALVLFWIGLRFVAREALRPLQSVTTALRRLADGDGTQQTLAFSAGMELVAIADAYNDAADRVAVALHERARMHERMRQFVADAGHELRTPLTVIAGYIDILRRGASAEPKVAAQILTSMSFEKEHMRALIDRLIRLSRLDAEAAPQRTAVDLDDVLRLQARTARHLDPGRPVNYRADPDAWAYADRDEIGEALWNVVENALKYAPGASIDMRAQRTGNNVVVTVEDHGPGMTEIERMQAFERFFRGDARGEVPGSGLGLAIAKRAVERSGGTIELRSAPGTGTTALITLPAAPES